MEEFDGETYEDPFMKDLVNFVADSHFQSLFENYFVTYSNEFSDEEEHKLRYYELYTEFQSLFEEQLLIFCDSQNLTIKEFVNKCNESSTKNIKSKHYVDILLSSCEYNTFVTLMKLMRRMREHTTYNTNAESKTTDSNIDSKGVPSEIKNPTAKWDHDTNTNANTNDSNLVEHRGESKVVEHRNESKENRMHK
mmetsp:Transcript_19341/g.17564  ORF Transcript_19341/g.17564 Transcript_19341/m.17564 type:complete len:194 (+) Transcript_19341:45-626(+)